MTSYTDIMVDVETTGTNPDKNGLLQIAAIKFNYATEEIGPVFDRCLGMAPGRYWDEDTRTWWMGQRRSIFNDIINRMEEPQTVLRDFAAFASADLPDEPVRFWAKPVHFDYRFIASHFESFGMAQPFHFRFTRDLNTFIAALAGGADHQDMPHIEAGSGAHNGLVDCVHQLKVLFAAKRGDFGPVVAEYEEAIFEEVPDANSAT